MRKVDIKEIPSALAELVAQGAEEPVAVLQHGKPVAVVVPTPNADWETVALSFNRDFLLLIDMSRRRGAVEGGIPESKLRKRFGLTSRETPPFEEVWRRIQAHQGEGFAQIRGAQFKYTCHNGFLKPDRTSQRIPKAHIETAYRWVPLENTVPVQHLRGPSYIYAILMDPRIRQTDW